MMFRNCALGIASALFAVVTFAQEESVRPPASLVIDGVPAIPAAIAAKIEPYAEFKAAAALAWVPGKRELLVRRRLANTYQLHRVAEPGAAPQPITDFPDAVTTASFTPKSGEFLLFPKAEGGNEQFRIFRMATGSSDAVAISPVGERAGAPEWSHKGDRIVYTTVLLDSGNPDRVARTFLHLADPRKPGSDRVIAKFESGGIGGFRFSHDDKRLVFVEERSANDSDLWVMDIASGKKRRLTSTAGKIPVYYEGPRFARDGKGVYVISDRGSEFRHLAYVPVAGGAEVPLAANLKFDVEEFAISWGVKRLAFTTNQAGTLVLRFLDLASLREVSRPALLPGVVSGLHWREESAEIAFTVSSARSPGDAFSYDLNLNQVVRWTNGNGPRVNTSAFVEPKTIRWKSFDGREITGLHYAPPTKFEGKRPVIIAIHGGPEGQATASFIGRGNYWLDELGIALIYPNVRGSSGFGKTFLKLDNGRLREDSVKDIGALLDWIKEQPDLDANKVIVTGGSYGGYMTLAVAARYSDRIAGAMETVGISNFVSFLERTESYRRDLRRVEYGDERDASMRAFLQEISPLTHVDAMRKPMLVAQGRNDPRVPWTESEQIVATLKKAGTPVWYILAGDEGHGFAKKANADFLFFASVEFVRALLRE
jgi:dipeptidyl aminopeptidase/acylaminoacyl peptidase